MRIRSVKPEFWRSHTLSKLTREQRLTWIGLWGCADDYGVGRDNPWLIAADLYAGDMAHDPHATIELVTSTFDALEAAGAINRFEHDGEQFYSIPKWERHQSISRPARSAYPRPAHWRTKASAAPLIDLGLDEPDSDDADATSHFEAFWLDYPRKVGKPAARAAYRAALRRADYEAIRAGLAAWLPKWETTEVKFIPHASTWLRRDGWDDVPDIETPPKSVRAKAREAQRARWAAQADAERQAIEGPAS